MVDANFLVIGLQVRDSGCEEQERENCLRGSCLMRVTVRSIRKPAFNMNA